jgi:hypothetical protein
MPSYPRSTRAAALMAALFASVLPSGAQGADAQNRVQLQVFQVKVTDSTGKPGQVPITFYIDSSSSRGAQSICSVGPRVRDALITHLRKETYPMNQQNQVDTVGIAEKARPVIEDVVKKENVTNVVVSMDPPKISAAGSGMFARMGCIGVAEESEKKGAKKK